MMRGGVECDNCGNKRKLAGARGYKGPKWLAHTTHGRTRCSHCGIPIPQDRDVVWRLWNKLFGDYEQ